MPKLRPSVRGRESKREAANREKKNIILEISLASKFQVQATQFKAVNKARLMYHINIQIEITRSTPNPFGYISSVHL